VERDDAENKEAECVENSCNEEKVETEENSCNCNNVAEESIKIVEDLKDKLKKAEDEVAALRDNILRKQADFENFRKRVNQEKQSAIEYANQSLLLDIIPIIDDFERAILAGENSTDIASFLDGIKMIEKRLSNQLESKWGLKRFNSAGEPFDPNMHEALMVEKSPDISEPVVREDLIRGYMLKERVIRAAKVKVLMPENTEKEGA